MNSGGFLDRLRALIRGKLFARGATAATAFIARAVQQIASLLMIILAASVLLPAEYGVYTLGVIFVLALQTLTYSGIFQYVVTASGEESEILDTSFWLMIGIATIGALGLLVLSPLISLIFQNPEIGEMVRWLALAQPPSAAVAWVSAVFMREQRLRTFYNVMIAQNVIAMICGVTLLFMWKSVFALVAYRFVRAIAGLILYFRYTSVWPGLKATKAEAKKTMKYASGLYGARASGFLSTYAGDILLGIFLSSAEAGIYRFGVRLATAVTDVIVQPMKFFALARFGADERAGESLGPSFQKFWSTTIVLIGGIAVCVSIFVEPAVQAFFRPEYLPAAIVATAFAVGTVCSAGVIYVEPALAARGKTGRAMAYNVARTTVLVLVILLTAHLGVAALSWAQAGVALLFSGVGLWMIAQEAPLDLKRLTSHTLQSGLVIAGLAVLVFGVRSVADIAGGDIATITAISVAGLLLLGAVAVSYRARLFSLEVFAN